MPARTADSEVEPYTPTYAQVVKMIQGWPGRASKYLDDTGIGSLQAKFVMLDLSNPRNMVAALNLLRTINKALLIRNTRLKAEELVRTK
jgi:hypothetical protein